MAVSNGTAIHDRCCWPLLPRESTIRPWPHDLIAKTLMPTFDKYLRICRVATLAVCLIGSDAVLRAADDAISNEFFEKKIRPVLVKHCHECHSTEAKELKGNLAVDTRDGLRRGGDNGPAVAPNDPDNSFLLRAIRHTEPGYEMPPDGKLTDEEIADFERWIQGGAPDPRDEAQPAPIRREIDLEAGRRFWAFQPLQVSNPPTVNKTAACDSMIDRHVVAQLEAVGLEPAAAADRRTLLRRVYFDLIGLPPTPEEITAFVADPAPNAFEKVVDRLLASPRFGERWGRHWLDVARYADSNGLDQNLTYYDAWRYRDYVVAAFNTDKPFDRFVIEQLAGDLLPYETDAQRTEQLVAAGFLMVGPKQLSERDKEKLRMDTVDEQIDTIGKALLGLTLGCARCHDHKFDPIPTADYYALAGIFRSTRTVSGIKLGNEFVSGWTVRPLPIDSAHAAALVDHEAKVKAVQVRLDAAKSELKKLGESGSLQPAASSLPGIVVDDVDAMRVGDWKDSTYTPRYVGQGYIHDDRTGKGQKSLTYVPTIPMAGLYEVRFSYTGGNGRSRKVPFTIRHAGGEETLLVNQQDSPAIQGLFQTLGRFQFDAGREGSVTISNTGTEGSHVVADAVQFIPVALLDNPAGANGTKADQPLGTADMARRDELAAAMKALDEELKTLAKAAPPPAPQAMAPEDVEDPGDYHVLIRGNHNRLGEVAPRGVIRVALPGAPPHFTAEHSGRLELAQWIASPDNPLTARVIANRVWQHLLGEGLVGSVDNFGELGDRPTHPRLLDYLATQLIARDWSIKALVREIVLTRTYCQSTQGDARAAEIDPENQLLAHAHRRRLEAEVLRDAMLAISGQLDLSHGGTFVAALPEQAFSNEGQSPIDTDAIRLRSVFLPILRSDIAPALAVFDFADPEMVTGRRDTTTVPTQALFLMNSPFVIEQSRAAAVALSKLPLTDEQRVDYFYQHAFGHPADSEQIAAALEFLHTRGPASSAAADESSATPDVLSPWVSFCQAVLASTEFRFVE